MSPPAVAPDMSVAASSPRLEELRAESFGVFGGADVVRVTGRFRGSTSLGDFHVPFEVVAPADPGRSNGTVVFEPPHFAFGPVGRDGILGRPFLFRAGYAWAAVGFGTNGLNVLDPTSGDVTIAGLPVVDPGALDPGGLVDEEILIQFARALREPGVLPIAPGGFERLYAFGVSQSAAVLLETLSNPLGRGVFDFTLLNAALWNPRFEPPGIWDFLASEFEPPAGAGPILFVQSEGDRIVSDAEQFRRAASLEGFRVYEVAGTPHLPSAFNPLDHALVVRAGWILGDAWARLGESPPPSVLLEEDRSGGPDPLYGFPTGIARDGDLNAKGGVRLPDLHVGRARFIASDFSVAPAPGWRVSSAPWSISRASRVPASTRDPASRTTAPTSRA